jgi:hypothetical protein
MKAVSSTCLAVPLVLITLACGSESSAPAVTIPTAPTPPASTFPTVTLTGNVIERVSGAPASGASVGVGSAQGSAPWTGSPGSARVDGEGRYQLKVREDPGPAYVKASKVGYVQQCAVSVTLRADVNVDLIITPFADVVTNGLPTAPNLRHISGVVYELTDNGRHPLSNAWVGWDALLDAVVAETRTDAQGRYRLCGIPMGKIDGLFAVRVTPSRPVYLSVGPGADAVVDFELP